MISARGVLSSATKEKAWGQFQRMLPSLKEEVSTVVRDEQLAALFCLTLAEETLNRNLVSPSASVPTTTLKSHERDITAYEAGSVLFRCKNKFCNVLTFEKLFSKLTDGDASTKLISVKTGDDLTQPSCDTVDFFAMIEIIFMNLWTLMSVPSVQKFAEDMCKEDDVTNHFINMTHYSDSEIMLQEKIFLHIIALFHKIRSHAKCRQTMELHTKTAGKQNRLCDRRLFWLLVGTPSALGPELQGGPSIAYSKFIHIYWKGRDGIQQWSASPYSYNTIYQGHMRLLDRAVSWDYQTDWLYGITQTLSSHILVFTLKHSRYCLSFNKKNVSQINTGSYTCK